MYARYVDQERGAKVPDAEIPTAFDVVKRYGLYFTPGGRGHVSLAEEKKEAVVVFSPEFTDRPGSASFAQFCKSRLLGYTVWGSAELLQRGFPDKVTEADEADVLEYQHAIPSLVEKYPWVKEHAISIEYHFAKDEGVAIASDEDSDTESDDHPDPAPEDDGAFAGDPTAKESAPTVGEMKDLAARYSGFDWVAHTATEYGDPEAIARLVTYVNAEKHAVEGAGGDAELPGNLFWERIKDPAHLRNQQVLAVGGGEGVLKELLI